METKAVNFNSRKKKYQVFDIEEGVPTTKVLCDSVLIKNLSQLHRHSVKKFSSGRSEHLFLVGDVEINPDASNIVMDWNTNIIYFPSKHDNFQVEVRGKGILDIEEYYGYDVYCRIRKYKSEVRLVKNID